VSGSVLAGGRRSGLGDRSPSRSWRQVVANGGWAALGALFIPFYPKPGWALLVGALAAGQADTWSTELGRHSRRPPRLLVGGRTVPPGTSGGVTWFGSGAGVVGAGAMGAVAYLVGVSPRVAAWSVVGGIGGTVMDSLLGSTIQARYRCEICDRALERAAHDCPQPARLVGGIRWVDNDVVNAAATATGGGITLIAAVLVPP
jgi:uncharacterized protein (TIGR00297 family)